MSEKNTGGPAFPSHGSMGEVTHEGMTLRDYFAAHAPSTPNGFEREKVMQINTGGGWVKSVSERYEFDCEVEIRWRWHYADMMLKAREV